MLEEFKRYKTYYDVSNYGYVVSIARIRRYTNRVANTPAKIMKATLNNRGYGQITFVDESGSSRLPLHRVIATLFVYNPEPEIRTYVNHIDGIKNNNRADNLEWVTFAQNMRHAAETGLIADKDAHGMAKLNNINVDEIKHLIYNGFSDIEIAPLFSVTPSCIYQIRVGNNWKTKDAENQSSC